MESHNIERGVVRRLFTINEENFRKILSEAILDNDELTSKFKRLSEHAIKLKDLDDEIIKVMLDSDYSETQLENELKAIDDYRNRWLLVETKYESTIRNLQEQSIHAYQDSNHSDKPKRKYNLPKLELKKFDGVIKNWISFWGQFRKIHDDNEIEDDDKYQYLLQTMEPGTEVREIVESFPPSAASYHDALTQLKSRFARDDLLIEVYVRELLGLVLLQAKHGDSLSLSSLFDKLSAHIRALESLGVSGNTYSAFIYPMIESALPTEILKAWERSRPGTSKDSSDLLLNGILDFLKREVDSDQRIKMARTSFSELHLEAALEQTEPSAGCLLTTNKQEKACIFCDKSTHVSLECYKLTKMTLDERMELLKKKKACTLCLKPGHYVEICKAYIKCCICTKRHSVILCPGKLEDINCNQPSPPLEEKHNSTKDTVNNLSLVQGVTLSQTIMVDIINGDKRETEVVLFGNGSQPSCIKQSVVEKPKIKQGGKETFNISDISEFWLLKIIDIKDPIGIKTKMKNDNETMISFVKYLQNLRDAFKQHFKTEFISTLVQRSNKYFGKLQEGDVVWLETKEKRVKWPLGIKA